jgi:hypothetical protein
LEAFKRRKVSAIKIPVSRSRRWERIRVQKSPFMIQWSGVKRSECSLTIFRCKRFLGAHNYIWYTISHEHQISFLGFPAHIVWLVLMSCIHTRSNILKDTDVGAFFSFVPQQSFECVSFWTRRKSIHVLCETRPRKHKWFLCFFGVVEFACCGVFVLHEIRFVFVTQLEEVHAWGREIFAKQKMC